MENQERFKEALGSLLAEAKEAGGRVTEETISRHFEGFPLTDEQRTLLYSYLELNQIEVEGHDTDKESLSYLKGGKETEEKPEKKLTGEDSRCYQMYLTELTHIQKIRETELPGLLAAAASGDRAARNRLTEGYLYRVVELAKEYAGRGVLMADLIQEGNMALFLSLDTFSGGEFGVHITKEVCSAMDAAVAEQSGQENTGSYLAAQANAMMKATEELVEELGREATLAEVAAKMNLSEDMTRDIMKISMDALSAATNSGSGEVYGEERPVSRTQ